MDDLISRQAAIDEWKNDFKGYINALNIPKDDYNGIMEYINEFPSAQPDGIPLEWIDKYLEWLDNCDNDFAQLAKVSIRAMVEIWKKDKTQSADRRHLIFCMTLLGAIIDTPNGDYHKAYKAYRHRLEILPSAQPERTKRIIGKSRDGMTMWYQCESCNEPVDEKDLFCRGCGRRFEDG